MQLPTIKLINLKIYDFSLIVNNIKTMNDTQIIITMGTKPGKTHLQSTLIINQVILFNTKEVSATTLYTPRYRPLCIRQQCIPDRIRATQ